MQPFKMSEMDVLILCGGFGTRLGSELQDRPKPMVDINGRPFLDFLIEHIASFGFTRFILCTGHKSQYIENYYRQKQIVPQWMISEEKTPLGTGGALKNAEHLIQSECFVVLNGDSFCPVPLKEFYEFHQGKKARLSLALTQVEEAEDFGSVRLSETNQILGFDEKSSSSKPSLVNAGVYFFNTKILSEIPPKEKVSLEYDFFPSFVGKDMFGYVTGERLFDIGTPERLSIARKNLV